MNGYHKLGLLYLALSSSVAVAGGCATLTFVAGPQGTNGSIGSPNYPLAYGEQQTCLYRFVFSTAVAHHTACFTFLKVALSGADSIAFLANGSQFLRYNSAGLQYDKTSSGVAIVNAVVRLTRKEPLCLTVTSNTVLTLQFVSKQRTNAMDDPVFYAKFAVSSNYESDSSTLQSPTWCMFGKKKTMIDASGSKAKSCVQQLCNAIDNSVFQCADEKLCIDSRGRCDRVPHCEDDSDEQDCQWYLECSFRTSEKKNWNKKCAGWSWEPVISQEVDLGISKSVSHTAGSGSLMLRANTKQSYIILAFSSQLPVLQSQRLCLQFWFQVRSPNTHNDAFMGLVEHVKSSALSKRILWLWNVAQMTDGWQSAYVEVALQTDQSILLVYMNSKAVQSHVEFYYDDVSEAFGKCVGDEQTMVDCTFERSMCGWSDAKSIWSLISMTDARVGVGLPLRDHTISVLAEADPDTNYLPRSGYIVSLSSSRLPANASAELVSVPLLLDVAGAKCLRFWIVCATAEKRAHCAKLVVSQQFIEYPYANASIAFQVLLPVATEWQQVAIELRGQSDMAYRIQIAYQPTDAQETFEIALDDIQLAHASCHAPLGEPETNITDVVTSSHISNTTVCPFRCPSSDDVNCLLPNHFCDGVIDCPDGSDEYSCGTVQFAKTVDTPKRDVITYTVSLAIVVCGSFIVFVIVSVFWVRAKLQRHRQQRANQLEMFSYPFSDSRNSLDQGELDPPPYWSLMGAESNAARVANDAAQKYNSPNSPDDDSLPPYEAVANCGQSL